MSTFQPNIANSPVCYDQNDQKDQNDQNNYTEQKQPNVAHIYREIERKTKEIELACIDIRETVKETERLRKLTKIINTINVFMVPLAAVLSLYAASLLYKKYL